MQSHKSTNVFWEGNNIAIVCIYIYICVCVCVYVHVYKLSNEEEQHEVKIKSIFELFKKEKRRRDHSSWKKEIWKALYNSSKSVRCLIYCKP